MSLNKPSLTNDHLISDVDNEKRVKFGFQTDDQTRNGPFEEKILLMAGYCFSFEHNSEESMRLAMKIKVLGSLRIWRLKIK